MNSSLTQALRNYKEKPKFNLLFSKIYNFFGSGSKKVRGKNNNVIYQGAYLKNVKIDISGNNNTIQINKLTKLKNCKIVIRGSNHELLLDERCYIVNTDFSFVQDRGKVKIGKQNHIGGMRLLSGEGKKIVIGDDCLFSSNIEIRTTDSHSIISMDDKKRINLPADVIIGNNVWVGNSCRLWKGAVIGNDSVIGFGSMVTKTIGSNCLAVGTPAKVLRENIVWNKKLIDEI